MTATTFASLTHGTSFRFADTTLAYAGTTLTDPTTYTKTGAFTFATGGKNVTLASVKTTKVHPLPPSFLF